MKEGTTMFQVYDNSVAMHSLPYFNKDMVKMSILSQKSKATGKSHSERAQ